MNVSKLGVLVRTTNTTPIQASALNLLVRTTPTPANHTRLSRLNVIVRTNDPTAWQSQQGAKRHLGADSFKLQIE